MIKINPFFPILGTSVLSASLVTFASVANAATVVIDFTDGAGNGLASFQKTAGTATATFSNPEGGTFNNLSGAGISLGSGSSPSFFDVSFDQDVELNSYTDGFELGTIDFDITGPGVSSLSNPQTGSDFVGQPLLLQANQNYTFTGNFSGAGNFVYFSTWTFDDAPVAESVPEPSTILGLLAVGSIGALTRKRK
ncbi:MAG: PEP-CTERM sorting domain-containing protein [Microcystaceae cyanobacterium]